MKINWIDFTYRLIKKIYAKRKSLNGTETIPDGFFRLLFINPGISSRPQTFISAIISEWNRLFCKEKKNRRVHKPSLNWLTEGEKYYIAINSYNYNTKCRYPNGVLHFRSPYRIRDR